MNRWKRSGIVAVLCLLPLLPAATLQEPQEKQSKAPNAVASKNQETKGDVAKGKAVFGDNCAVCHSAETDEAIVGPGLKNLFHWPPHKMSDGTEHQEHTVEIIRKQIVEGGGSMAPAGASFSDQEVADLITYLQTL